MHARVKEKECVREREKERQGVLEREREREEGKSVRNRESACARESEG